MKAPYCELLEALSDTLPAECLIHDPLRLLAYGSDASYTHRYGTIGRPVNLSIPTENTHGYEISNLTVMENTVALLAAYLKKE